MSPGRFFHRLACGSQGRRRAGCQHVLPAEVETLECRTLLSGAMITVNQSWITQNLSDGALFFDQANTTYRFEADFHAAGTALFVMASDVTIDLNGHTVSFGRNDHDGTVGINPFKARSATSLGSDDVHFARTAAGNWGNAGRLVIENGRVVWAGTNGTWACAIGGNYVPGDITIRNMYLESGGSDGSVIHLGNRATVHDSHLVNRSAATEDRHQGPAAIIAGDSLTVNNCVIEGGNSGINAGSNAVISDNVIRHSGFATNGYGVFLYRNSNATITNNLIVPKNGRGILYNAGEKHSSRGNLIVVHEQPNAEFGDALDATGFRSRYAALETEFVDNQVLAIGGGSNASAAGAFLSTYDTQGRVNRIVGNEFRTILTTAPTGIRPYANAITFEGHGSASEFADDVIENNRFASNHLLMRFSGYDGGVYQDAIGRNFLDWEGGDETYDWLAAAISDARFDYDYGAGNTYVTDSLLQQFKDEVLQEVHGLISGVTDDQQRKTFFTGWSSGFDSRITLIDPVAGTGVGLGAAETISMTSYSVDVDIRIGHSLHVIAKGPGGGVIANSGILVHDSSGLTYTGTTDANGRARLELIDYALVRSPSSNTPAVTQVERSGHRVSVAGYLPLNLPSDLKENAADPLVLNFGVAAATLTAPGSAATAPTTTFAWSAVAAAQRYDLWVNDLTTGQSAVIRNTSVPSNLFATTGVLADAHYFAWTVRAIFSDGSAGDWAATGYFRKLITPDPPAVFLPGPVAISGLPAFAWAGVAGAHHYDVWVNNLTTGQSSVIRNQNVGGTSFTATQPLVDGHTYIWTVRAVSEIGTAGGWAAHRIFRVKSVPDVPSGLSPDLTGITTSAKPIFTWGPVTGADHYDIWVNNVNTGQSGVLRDVHVVGNRYTAPTALTDGHTYLWTVRAVYSNGVAGAWAAAKSFRIQTVPGRPVIVGPSMATGGSSPTPTFRWNVVPGAVRYDVWVIDDTAGNPQVLRDQNIGSNSWTPSTSLPQNHWYRWSVRAFFDTGMGGEWAATTGFQIAAPPARPSLLGPAGGSQSSRPVFTWTAVAGAVRYDLWIVDQTTGNATVLRNQNVGGTSFTPTVSLAMGHRFAWTVRAVSVSGAVSEWAATGYFQVAAASDGGIGAELCSGASRGRSVDSLPPCGEERNGPIAPLGEVSERFSIPNSGAFDVSIFAALVAEEERASGDSTVAAHPAELAVPPDQAETRTRRYRQSDAVLADWFTVEWWAPSGEALVSSV